MLMPVIFVGHGSPENAIEDNDFSNEWKRLGKILPKPKAILCISAHWQIEGCAITAMENPKTIHDFYGFQEALYKVRYPVKGDLKLANRIKSLIGAELDYEWGLDHGTWSVLLHMYPKADIPTLQLSMDYNLSLEKIYEVGKKLKVLREEGVLIIGSGNLVHNLMRMQMNGKPFDWAKDFDDFVKRNLEKRDDFALINYSDQKTAIMAHPSNDHYLPLIYVLGLSVGEKVSFFNEKIVMGSVSMQSFVIGLKK